MGEVFLARHRRTGTAVAIKRLPPEADPRIRAFQDAEVRATAALDHPNVVRIVDTGTLGEQGRWLALEWCEGGTLESVSDVATLAKAIRDVLAGLAHAHAHGILHRDVKPGNVLVDATGTWKLADFGVARIEHVPTSQIVGSPAYLAPEVVDRSQRVGPAADLYSFGCTVWEIVTGSPPFDAEHPRDLVRLHQTAALPAFAPRFQVPPTLLPWLQRLLAKRPADRPASAAEALARFEEPSLPTPWRPTVPGLYAPAPARGRDSRLQDAGADLLPYREPPLLGRDPQLTSLWQRLHEVVERSAPYVVILTGPADVGRTRLAQSLARDAAERGLAVWTQLDFAAGGLGALRDTVGGIDGAALDAWRREHPAVLVLDDLSDPSTARAIGDLVVGCRAPVLWLVTATAVPEPLVRRLPIDDWEELVVRPLPTGMIGQLLHRILPLQPELNSAIARDAAGLPGRALRVLEDGVASGALVPGEAGYVLQPTDPPPLPPSTKTALQVLALAEGRLDAERWQRACNAGGLGIDWDALSPLIRRGSLRIDPQDRLILALGPRQILAAEGLANPAIQPACTALLADLEPDDDRKGLLLIAAGCPTDGVDTLLEAAEHARRDGDRGRALELVQRAAEVAATLDPDRLWRSRILLALLWMDTWRVDHTLACIAAWETEMESASPAQRAELAVRKGTALRYRGESQAARTALEAARRLSTDQDEEVRSSILNACASQLVSMGAIDEAAPLAREALELARSSESRAYAALTYGRILSGRGDATGAIAVLEQGRTWSREAGRRVTEVNVLSILGETSSRAGDLDTAGRYLTEACAIAAHLPGFDAVMLEINLIANDLRRERYAAALARADALVHDPRVRRLAIARVGVALMRTVGTAGLGQWTAYAAAVNTFLGYLEQYPGIFDPDFVDFSEKVLHLVRGAPSDAQRLAREMVTTSRLLAPAG